MISDRPYSHTMADTLTMADSVTIDLSDINSTLTTFDSLTGPVYTISNSGTAWEPLISLPNHNTLEINGEDADVKINGVSLMETLRGIRECLNVLSPNPELEKEWHELRDLRDQYEAKLKECKEKSKVWQALTS